MIYLVFCKNILALIAGSREDDDWICENICHKDIFSYFIVPFLLAILNAYAKT